jgi:osmotically-inducible protein OsmY
MILVSRELPGGWSARATATSTNQRTCAATWTIESRVRVAIGSDVATAGEKFEVESVDGVVYLRGTVRTPTAARRAVQLAAMVDGVRRVIERTRTVRVASAPSASE